MHGSLLLSSGYFLGKCLLACQAIPCVATFTMVQLHPHWLTLLLPILSISLKGIFWPL